MNKAKVVVVQKVLEGLGQGFVDSADQQTALIFWRPSNTHKKGLTSQLFRPDTAPVKRCGEVGCFDQCSETGLATL